MQAHGKPNILSLILNNKERVANVSGYKSDFGGVQHGCVCALRAINRTPCPLILNFYNQENWDAH